MTPLSSALRALREKATKEHFPLAVVRSDPEGRALILGKFIQIHVDTRQRYEDPSEIAALIVLLANSSEQIVAALELSDAVLAPLGKDRSWTLCGQDILRDPDGTKAAEDAFWKALSRFRSATRVGP